MYPLCAPRSSPAKRLNAPILSPLAHFLNVCTSSVTIFLASPKSIMVFLS